MSEEEQKDAKKLPTSGTKLLESALLAASGKSDEEKDTPNE